MKTCRSGDSARHRHSDIFSAGRKEPGCDRSVDTSADGEFHHTAQTAAAVGQQRQDQHGLLGIKSPPHQPRPEGMRHPTPERDIDIFRTQLVTGITKPSTGIKKMQRPAAFRAEGQHGDVSAREISAAGSQNRHPACGIGCPQLSLDTAPSGTDGICHPVHSRCPRSGETHDTSRGHDGIYALRSHSHSIGPRHTRAMNQRCGDRAQSAVGRHGIYPVGAPCHQVMAPVTTSRRAP